MPAPVGNTGRVRRVFWRLFFALLAGGILSAGLPVAACLVLPVLRDRGRCATSSVVPEDALRHSPGPSFPYNGGTSASFASATEYRVSYGMMWFVYELDELHVGWPWMSAEGARLTRIQVSGIADNIVTRYLDVDTAAETRILGAKGLLPKTLVWRGVLGNWAAWSLICGVLLAAFAVFRSTRHRPKGACKKCRYATHGLERCPECGEPVESQHGLNV